MQAKPRLTEELRAEIAQIFQDFDKNGDGHISVDELGEAMKQAGQDLSEVELKDMIRAVSHRDGNGTVEYAEFEDMMVPHMGDPITSDELKYCFKKFDTNGDGFITSDELALVMNKFGGKSFSKQEIDDLIAQIDVNADGKVDFEEFVQMMKKKEGKVTTGAESRDMMTNF